MQTKRPVVENDCELGVVSLYLEKHAGSSGKTTSLMLTILCKSFTIILCCQEILYKLHYILTYFLKLGGLKRFQLKKELEMPQDIQDQKGKKVDDQDSPFLVDLVQGNEPFVAFVGAGASRLAPSNLPTWNEFNNLLLECLCERLAEYSDKRQLP